MKHLPISVLKEFSSNNISLESLLLKELDSFKQKIVVLDDDPTGIQTVHGVYVYTDWSEDTLRRAFTDGNRMFFILTNSRSMTEEETASAHRKLRAILLRPQKQQSKTI